MHQDYNIDELNEKYNNLKEQRKKKKGMDIKEMTQVFKKEVEVLEKIVEAHRVEIRSKLDEMKELNDKK